MSPPIISGTTVNPEFGEFVALFLTAHVVLLINYYLTVKKEVGERIVVPILVLSIPVSYSLFFAGYIVLLTNSDFAFDRVEALIWWIISGISWKLLETSYGMLFSPR